MIRNRKVDKIYDRNFAAALRKIVFSSVFLFLSKRAVGSNPACVCLVLALLILLFEARHTHLGIEMILWFEKELDNLTLRVSMKKYSKINRGKSFSLICLMSKPEKRI